MTRTDVSSRLAGGSGGCANPRRPVGAFWRRALLALGLVATAITAQPVFACATVGVCGTRTIDGNTADWNLTKDLYSEMREAGRTDKSQLGNFYFSYDSTTQTASVLVLATGTNEVVQSTADAWVKNYAVGTSPITFTAFKWVVSNGKTVGYEASFKLAPGSYSQFEVHVQIKTGRTCSTGKQNVPYSSLITLKTPSCGTTPTGGGTAKCGTAKVDGSIAEWDTSATSTDRFSKLFQESTSLQTGNLFVRYDQANQTAYVLALTTSGYVAISYLPWNWVTLDGQTVVSATSGTTANFAWVRNASNALVGYEASFKLAPGTWQRLHAQLKTAPSSNTSNHFKATNGDQTLVANCGGSTCTTGKSATVDGKITDWDLTADLLKPMLKEYSSTQTADLYVRYDPANNRAYVLTLARTGYMAINYLPWNFVTLNGTQVVTATDSTTSTAFRWVYNSGGTRIGYEASFALTAGSTATIFAQLKTAPFSSPTSHFKSQVSGTINTVCAPVTYALGNQVYQEKNGTAGYSTTTGTTPDAPLANVTVQLYQGTQLVTTKTTGPDGCYLFDGLAAGSYTVVLPASQFATGAALNALRVSAIGFGSNTSTDDGADHNGSQQVVDGDVRTNDYSLGAGLQPTGERLNTCSTGSTTLDANNNLTADIALEAKPVAAVVYGIGNRVWFEKNGAPGYQPTGTNPDLPAIGIPVDLTGLFGGPAINTVTTGADGCYLFDGLSAGDYALRISAASMAGGVLNGFVPVTAVGTGNVDDNADQNGALQVGGDVTTAAYALGTGKQPTSVSGAACSTYTTTTPTANLNLTADFAFQLAPVVKVALGNQVYKEVNGTAGYQTTGVNPDLPLKGVVVDLYDANGPTGKTATTGDDGCYLFDSLDSGNYSAVLPADQFGAAGTLKGLRASTIGLGNDATTDDSRDHNGTQATLDGAVKSNTIALTPGTQPENERTTACKPGATIPDKNTNLTVDFALEDKPITEVAIGNRVWKDMDGDGKFTQGTDQPLSGVTVTLVNNDTDESYQATTNGQGCYLVRGLSAGSYVAKILAGQSALAGLQGVAIDGGNLSLAGDDETTDDNGDQNGVQDAGGDTQTGLFDLAPGTEPTNEASSAACGLVPSTATLPDANVNETADFAFMEPPPIVKVALGNLVWVDLDGLPGYTPGVDQPRANVTLELRNEDGSVVPNVAPTTTDSDGCYLFDNLDAGTYYVSLPATNFRPGGALNGYSPLPDPDGDGGPLNSYGDDPILDDDTDQNGRPEAGATGNVVTSLFALARDTQPMGEAGTACASKQSDLPDANVNQTADFAFEAKVAIGNLVWIDGNSRPGFQAGSTDKNLFDALGKEVQVNLHQVTYDADNNLVDAVVKQMNTVGGFYLFDSLSPGQYYVEIPAKEFDTGALSGYESMSGSGNDQVTDDQIDENGIDAAQPNLTGVTTRVYDLQPGTQPGFGDELGQRSPTLTTMLPDESVNLTADLAFVKGAPPGAGLMSLGSTVYLDLNHNGRLDGSEPVVPGVTVLLDFTDPILGTPVTLTDTTDGNGNYFFGSLDIGVAYTVRISVSQMDAGSPSGKLAQFIRDYYANLPVGIDPNKVPVKPLSTLDTAGSASDSQIDNDDNGLQANFGAETLSPAVTLVFGNEPVNGTGANKESAAGGDTAGFDQDNTTGQVDNNGEMTVDFGFVHQCQSICDMNGDGKVTDTDLSQILRLRGTTIQDTSKWGAPGTGDCGGTGVISGNDYAWCRAFSLIN